MAVLSVQADGFQYVYTFSSITNNTSITPKKLHCANVGMIPAPSLRTRLSSAFCLYNFSFFKKTFL